MKCPAIVLVLPLLLNATLVGQDAVPPATPPAATGAASQASPEVDPVPGSPESIANSKRRAANGNAATSAAATKEKGLRDQVSQRGAPVAVGKSDTGATPQGGGARVPVDTTPVIRVEPEVLDLGEMIVDTAKTGKVKLINISDKPVTIAKAITSCGCTTAGTPKEPIAPGASAEVEISLKPGPKPGVPLSKRVTFQIDGHAPVMLTVQGKVPAYIVMTPDMLEAPGEGKTNEGEIIVKSVDNTPFRITAVTPPILPDAGTEAAVEHKVHVDWKTWEETGKTIKLSISTDHPKVPSLSCLIRRPAGSASEPRTPGGPNPGDRAASALVTAARSGDVERVKKELEGGAVIDAPDSSGGRSALHWAAREDKTEVIAVLLEKGAKVEVKDRAGKTPLCIAAESGKGASVKLLLAAKADVDSTDRLGGTPLMWASALGSPETVGLLIEANAKINVADKNGLTPLLWAAGIGNPESVQLLIDKGADMAVADNLTGDTALMRAARNGKLESLQALLNAKAAIDALNRQGMSVWLIAAANGRVEKLHALKLAGVNVDALDGRGWNAVDHARNRSDGNRAEVIKYLEEELKMKPAMAKAPDSPPTAPGGSK